MGSDYRGRFAPSPTGFLHLGNLWVALISYCAARQAGGKWLLRIEDIDRQRCREKWEKAIYEDLQELGFEPDEVTSRQQDRCERYQEIIEKWKKLGYVYPCDCNRARIQKICSAPHLNEVAIRYDGKCRRSCRHSLAGIPSWRYAGEDRIVRYRKHGQNEAQVCALQRYKDDIVLQRSDGMYNYQFVVAVDDFDMGVTEVVRGSDLEDSTPLQVRLIRDLGGIAPIYFHVPLLVDKDGYRLSKRQHGLTWRDYRAADKSVGEIIGDLLFWAGVNPLREVRTLVDAIQIPLTEWKLDVPFIEVREHI